MSVLWSVLAGIGTVLLFLLKGVGILLLVVLVLGLLLMFCPFCADVQWAEGIFQVKAGALGITFPVFRYPAPEKPEKKEKKKKASGAQKPQKRQKSKWKPCRKRTLQSCWKPCRTRQHSTALSHSWPCSQVPAGARYAPCAGRTLTLTRV